MRLLSRRESGEKSPDLRRLLDVSFPRKILGSMPAQPLRFSKTARLTEASEFARLKAEGTSFHGQLFILSVLQVHPEHETRIGFITSRRVGAAVQRNRVRRRLREIVRLDRPRLRAGLWLALIARRSAAEATSAALQREWQTLTRRSAIFR